MAGLIDMVMGKDKDADMGKGEFNKKRGKDLEKAGYRKVEPSKKTESKGRVLDAIKNKKKLSPEDAATYANSLAGM